MSTQITGYRTLSEEEIELMNEIKAKAVECGELVEKLRSPLPESNLADGRWISIGATDLQTGFMALVRSIAKPTTF